MIMITSEISLKEASTHLEAREALTEAMERSVLELERFLVYLLFICFFILPGVGDVFTRSCCGGAELPQGRVEIAQRPRLGERDIIGLKVG